MILLLNLKDCREDMRQCIIDGLSENGTKANVDLDEERLACLIDYLLIGIIKYTEDWPSEENTKVPDLRSSEEVIELLSSWPSEENAEQSDSWLITGQTSQKEKTRQNAAFVFSDLKMAARPRLLCRRCIRIKDVVYSMLLALLPYAVSDPRNNLETFLSGQLPAADIQVTACAFAVAILTTVYNVSRKPRLDRSEHCLFVKACFLMRRRQFNLKDAISWFLANQNCDIPIKKYWICEFRNLGMCGANSEQIEISFDRLVDKGFFCARKNAMYVVNPDMLALPLKEGSC